MRTCPTCHRTFSDETSFCPRDGTPLPAPPTLAETGALGSISGRYRIIRPLGAGGMGSVFLAEQVAVGNRLVALKLLARKLLDDPEFLERFRNEAASTGRIRHSNVVTIYESGQTDDGTPYIAMEYLEGKNLRQTIASRGRLPVFEAAEIVQQTARGLNAAHKLGVIHRDLKPDNIFLTRDDEGALLVKVVDFGIAKLRESAMHTVTGGFLGTPAYMSFEQASGMRSGDLDARSDVYSLGIVAYEMLSGQVPFHAETSLGYVRKHLTEPPPPFRKLDPALALPEQIESVVMKALEKDRDHRYTGVIDFARDFTAAAVGGGTAEYGAAQGEQQRARASQIPMISAPQAALRSGGHSGEAAARESDVAVQTPPPMTPTPSSGTPAERLSAEEAIEARASDSSVAAESSEFAQGQQGEARHEVTDSALVSTTRRAPPAISTRESRREERLRHRMEKISRRLDSLDQERPVWKRPLPVALLSILLAMIILGVFHRGPAPKPSSSEPNESRKAGEEASRFGEAERQEAERQAAKTEEVLSELRKNGLIGNRQPGKVTPGGHPTLPVPGAPPEAPPASGQTQTKIILAPLAPRPWQGEVNEGELIGQQFIDGGLRLEHASVPPEVLGRAPAGGLVTVQLEIDEDGSVYKGRRLAGDGSVAKSVIQAARDGWRFSPPRVNGTPVRASAAVTVQF